MMLLCLLIKITFLQSTVPPLQKMKIKDANAEVPKPEVQGANPKEEAMEKKRRRKKQRKNLAGIEGVYLVESLK